MPITRMDMMTMAPKTQEATPLKVNEHTRPLNEQMMREAMMDKQIIQNGQKIVHMTEANNPEYRFDAKEESRNKYRPKKKQGKRFGQEEEEKMKDDRRDYIRPFHIDIMI